MEILLLLSAFLTAQTGAITGTRPAQGVATTQVSGQVAVKAAAAATATVAPARMVQAWLPLVIRELGAPVAVPGPVVALFAQRRRL